MQAATMRSTSQSMQTSTNSMLMGGSSAAVPGQSFLSTLEANLLLKYKNGMQVCLTCLDHVCGRYEQSHAVQHNRDSPDHCLTLNSLSLQIWCYACDEELSTVTSVNGPDSVNVSEVVD